MAPQISNLLTHLLNYLAGPVYALEMDPSAVFLKKYFLRPAGWQSQIIKNQYLWDDKFLAILQQADRDSASYPRVYLFLKQFLASVKSRLPRLKKISLVLPPQLADWQTQFLPATSNQEIKQLLAWEQGPGDGLKLVGWQVLARSCRDGLSQVKIVTGRLALETVDYLREILDGFDLELSQICLRWPADLTEVSRAGSWPSGLLIKPQTDVRMVTPWIKRLKPVIIWPLTACFIIFLAGCFLTNRPTTARLSSVDAPETSLSPSGETNAADFPGGLPVSPSRAEYALAQSPSGQASSAQPLASRSQPTLEETDGLDLSITPSISRETLLKNYRLEGVVLGRQDRAIFTGPGGHCVLTRSQNLVEDWRLVKVGRDSVWLAGQNGESFEMILQ